MTYYDPDDSFLSEMKTYFENNRITKEELLTEYGLEKVPFLNRYDPSSATIEQERTRIENLSNNRTRKNTHRKLIEKFKRQNATFK